MADYNPLGKARFPYNQEADSGWETRSYPDSTSFESAVAQTFQELVDLLLSKHKDYGPKNIADAPGGALNGLRVRIHDKTARINNLVDSGESQRMNLLKIPLRTWRITQSLDYGAER
jgi:hypothetical protein